MEPVKLIPADQAPLQPAYNTKSKRGKATQHGAAASWRQESSEARRETGRARRENSAARRQLAQACTVLISDQTYGDINFDCQFTFVQVCFDCFCTGTSTLSGQFTFVHVCRQFSRWLLMRSSRAIALKRCHCRKHTTHRSLVRYRTCKMPVPDRATSIVTILLMAAKSLQFTAEVRQAFATSYHHRHAAYNHFI